MRKIRIISLLFVLLFVNIFTYNPSTVEAKFDVDVDTAILIDADTGKILFEKNVDQPLPPASMTKMMSEYLILEAIHNGDISWDDEVEISEFLANLSHNRGLSNVMLRVDETYTVKELYEAVAIYSANAATMALAEHIAGSYGNFVQMMNEKGKELGMGKLLREEGEKYGLDDLEEIAEEQLGDFQFVNSTGLPNRLLEGHHAEGTGENEDNYMSARATAILAYHLINDFPEVLETASIPEKVFKEGTDDAITMQNWNKMIVGTPTPEWDYEYVDGLKTGHTDVAGYCFTGTAEKDGKRLISVVMGGDTEGERFTETKKLLEYGFDNFSKIELYPENMTIEGYETLPVTKGKEDEVTIATTDSISTFAHNNEVDAYSYTVSFDESLFDEEGRLIAPVEKGQVVGKLTVVYEGDEEEKFLVENGKNNYTVDIVTTGEVEKAGWFTLLFRGIGEFFSGVWNTVADSVRGFFD